MDMSRDMTDEEIEELIASAVSKEARREMISVRQRVILETQIFNALRKLDVLQELVDNPQITEIMVNGPNNIFYEKAGMIYKFDGGFSSDDKMQDVIQQIVGRHNRVVNQASPIVDTRLSKISSIGENTEMYNYFSKELISNSITKELNDHMIIGKDIINPLLESSINGSLSEDENYIDKVYSLLTENYCKIKTLINSLNKNYVKIESLKNNNEFIVYLYISVLILMTLSVISSSSSKNKVFEVVDFDTIMQVLRIDYKKVFTESDILEFISDELNK